MRFLPLALTAGVLCAGHELATDYGRERTLTLSSELELDLETTLMEMKIDGEPVEGRGPGGGSSLVRTCVLVDHVLAGAKGAPQHVKRTFETLKDKSSFSFGEEERTDEREFPLNGLTLELTLDDEGKVQTELVEGTAPDDEALLEGHTLALTLDALLPAGAVELEAAWDLDDEAVKRALGSALDAKLFADPPPEEGGGGERGERGGDRGRGPGRGRGGAGRYLGHLVWTGKAKLVAMDAEHAGLACAEIKLELTGEGELPEPTFRGPPRGYLFELSPTSAPRAGTVKAHLEGSLFVSLEQGRPVALALDGELATENSFEREREGQVMQSHTRQEGRLTLKAQLEEQ